MIGAVAAVVAWTGPRSFPDLFGGSGHPMPWSWWLFLLGTLNLGFALATTGNLVLRSVGESHRVRRFLWLWIGTFAAALLAAGAVALGELLGAGVAWSATAAGTALAGAAATALHWALLPGVAAAAVTTLLGAPRPVASVGAPLYLRSAVAGSLGLAAALTGWLLVGLASAAAGDSIPAASGAEVPPSARPSPSSEPSDPALLTNPEVAKPFPGRCAAEALAVSYRFADAATGTRYGLLTVSNNGVSACTLKGYPDLAFADVAGNNVRVNYEHGRWTGAGQKVLAIRLEPGGSARAELTWRGDAGVHDREVDTVLAAPWAGAMRTECFDRFDMRNGSTMRVSPWLPTK